MKPLKSLMHRNFKPFHEIKPILTKEVSLDILAEIALVELLRVYPTDCNNNSKRIFRNNV